MRRTFGPIILLLIFFLLFPGLPLTEAGDEIYANELENKPIAPTKGPMNSPWPMFKNDMGCTGLSKANTSRNPGRLIWEFKASGEISTPVIDNAGLLYFTSEPGYLYCIYPDGKQKWMTPINTSGFNQAPALASDGTIYVHSLDGGLYAYHGNGSLKWFTDTGFRGTTPPIIGSEGNILVGMINHSISSYHANLISIFPNGTIQWIGEEELQNDQFISIQPNSTILMPTSHTINMYFPNGSLKNRVTDNGNMSYSSATVASNGSFYFSTFQGGLISMDQNGSNIFWRGDLLSAYGITYTSPSIGPDGTIYIHDNGRRIKSYLPNGTPGWSYSFSEWARGTASNPSIGNDGTLFFGKKDVGAFAVWPNGSQRWKIENIGVSNSNPAIDAFGTIYYPGWDGSLYAVGSVKPDPPILNGNGRGGKISLSWAYPEFDGGEDITLYSIYRGPDPLNLSLLKTSSSDFTSYTDTEVIPGVDYYYTVTATNRRGESDHSRIKKLIPLIRPDPPILKNLNNFEYYITISWDPPEFQGGASIENYSVYRNNDGGDFIKIATTPTDLTSFRDNDIHPGMIQIYYVTATNSEGESLPSAMLWGDTFEVPDPPILQNLTKHNEEFINITWSDPEYNGGQPITEYEVQKKIDEGSFTTYINVNATTQTNTIFDPFIVSDRKYSYRVIAINSQGMSDPSNVESIILHTPPNPPQNLTVGNMDGALKIEWEHPIPTRYSPLLNYNISFYVNDEWLTPLQVISKNDTSFLYNGMNGEKVIVRLLAHNDYGNSEYVEVTGTPGRAPDPPIDVTALFDTDKVMISWAPPPINGGYDVFRYHVQRKIDDGNYERIATVNYLTFSFIDEDVEPGVNYHYFIEAENDIGISDPSDVVSVFEPIIYPPPPAPEIYLTTKGILYIKIHWKFGDFENPEIDHFIVYRKWTELGSVQSIKINLSLDSRSYNDTDIMFDVNYTYQVTTVNQHGESDKSNLIDIRVRDLSKPGDNETGNRKDTPNLAIIYGLVGALIILAAAGIVYFVMTKRGPLEPPPGEFEIEAEPLKSSVTSDDR